MTKEEARIFDVVEDCRTNSSLFTYQLSANIAKTINARNSEFIHIPEELQPIETAPRGGIIFFGYLSCGSAVVCYRLDDAKWFNKSLGEIPSELRIGWSPFF